MTARPVSVQLYSVRDAISADLPGTLQRLADIGFREVELYGFVDRAEEYATALSAAGLAAPSAHVGLIGLDDPRPAFEAARTVGVHTVIDPYHDRDSWTDADQVKRAADRLNEVAAAAREFDLAVGYHNHDFEVAAKHNGTPALEVLAAALDPAVVLEVDTFWVEVGGESAPALLSRLGDRVQFIHVKDGPLNHETKQQLPAGQGAVDVPAILAAAPQAQRVLEFDDYDGDVLDAVAVSLAFVTGNDPAAQA